MKLIMMNGLHKGEEIEWHDAPPTFRFVEMPDIKVANFDGVNSAPTETKVTVYKRKLVTDKVAYYKNYTK
jgi:hypothetical protein